MNEEFFMEMLKDIQNDFSMATYDVIKNNCNHFTGRAAELLIG